jgi:multisite-specific tRNA:(cytosine-C5)-methyltransferase
LDHPTQVNESTIAIGCWKGRASLTVMVTAIDCQELLERLLMRKEPENGSSVQEEESNVEANKVQDLNDIEKNEHAESIKLATSS